MALGLTDYPEGDDRRYNLKRFVEELDTPAIRAAQAQVDANPEALVRISNRASKRLTRSKTTAASVTPERTEHEQTPKRRKNARRVADSDDDDDDDDAMA